MPAAVAKPGSQVSTDARRVLAYLRTCAPSPDCARTDGRIAEALDLPHRDIVDLADELLRAGYGVVARCSRPMGRFLTDDPAVLRAYAEPLRKRARKIMVRAMYADRLAARLDAGIMPVDTTGQGRLFG